MGPLSGVWVNVLYICFLYQINYKNRIPIGLMLLFFLPVILIELAGGGIFLSRRPLRLWPLELKEKIAVALRIMLWFFIYLFYLNAVYSTHQPWATDTQIRLFFGFPLQHIINFVCAILRAQWLYALAAFFLWFLIYWAVVVKRRKLRIVVSLILPGACAYGLMAHFYFFGGMGSASGNSIAGQPGVKIFYTEDNFPRRDYAHFMQWTKKVKLNPGGIIIDNRQNALYAVYANTFHEEKKIFPCLLRIDMETRSTVYRTSYYARSICQTSDTVIIAPWFERKIYEFRKDDLSLVRSFPFDGGIYPFKIRDIHYSEAENCLYVTHDMQSVLQKYDYSTGSLVMETDPAGFKDYGTVELWLMQVSEKTGMIYIVPQAAKDMNIIEIDPSTLKITRTLDFDIVEPTALKIDDEQGVLYCQDGGSSRLYEIDIRKFTVKRLLSGEVHSRRISIDRQRRCLYLLGYFYGRIVALDLESGKRKWSLKVGGKPYGLAREGDRLYISSMSGIIYLDLNSVWNKYDRTD
ncbi:MAG: hypothetical protein ABIH89_04985 [Elusimicrobiota bacterium]